jgi:L-threonylcarbamoyladenylate synthase
METKQLYVQEDDVFQISSSFLKKGHVVAFPTDTVYGIGADIYEIKAIKKLYSIKKRDLRKSFPMLVSDLEQVEAIAKNIPDDFYILAKHFWPGPLTIILKKDKDAFSYISPSDSIAFRMPANQEALELISQVNNPIVATSANISGERDLLLADEVFSKFKGQISAVIYGNKCSIGLPSTVIDLTSSEYKILRSGSITEAQIEKVLKNK